MPSNSQLTSGHTTAAVACALLVIGLGVFAWRRGRILSTRRRRTTGEATFLGNGVASTGFVPIVYKEKKIVSHDVRIFRFALDSPQQVLGLPVGQHISLKASVGGRDVIRTYTPVSTDLDQGFFDLMVKVYFSQPPKFPSGGKMSQLLDSLQPGDTMMVKGPTGKFTYLGKGEYTIKVGADKVEKRRARTIGMIAGGSGITPMLQLIHAVSRETDADSRPTLKLIFSNHTAEDMLCLAELKEYEQQSKLKLFCTVTRPTAAEGSTWQGLTGRVNTSMLSSCFGAPSETDVCFLCGPSGLIHETCIPLLKAAGYSDTQLVAF